MFFLFQAEVVIRAHLWSRGRGDSYKIHIEYPSFLLYTFRNCYLFLWCFSLTDGIIAILHICGIQGKGYDMDLSLYNENQIALLEDLTKRTAAGTINWEDVSYNPIGVLVDEKDDGTCEYILTHIISCTTGLSGIILDIELSENLDILTGKGDVFVTETKSGVAGFDVSNIS